MTAFAFRRDAGEFASEAWRALDRAVYRWVLAHGGSTLLAQVAAWASHADGAGDTALPLVGEGTARPGMPEWDADDIAALRREPMVTGDAADTRVPFVLDAAARFYLHRNHRDECRVAALVRARRTGSTGAAVFEADLDALFHGDRGDAVQAQRQAVRDVVGRRLFVLTGGPGTGKTTTVLRMLLMLQRCNPQPLRIRAAAPTGKAAQRLLDALRDGRQRLFDHPACPLSPDWQPLGDALPLDDALTLHRLLGYEPHRNAFRHNARAPLPADVVVVDEASMVDLAMLRALLEAVRSDATLILLGDADQLTSVAAGSVLMDLVSTLEADGGGDLVRLRHSFRAEQHLVAINDAVRTGSADGFAQALANAGLFSVHRRIETGAQLSTQLRAWGDRIAALEGLRPILDGTDEAADASAVLAALDALTTCQLLCALREDAFGSLAVNRQLERQLRRAWSQPDTAEWYPGRAVIVTRNDYGARLFNGDIGLCLADRAGQLRVWFETVDAGGTRGVRTFAPGALPPHEPAFAVTVHKSQGSEYERVAVLLPPDPDSRILSRQLLYTGVSRAKQAVELWAGEAALAAALDRPVRRCGGLADRLRAGATAGSG